MERLERGKTIFLSPRYQYINATTISEKIEADAKVSSVLQGLRMTVESYPELKANPNFLHLQLEISDIENKLAPARRFFNDSTKEYNTSVESFLITLLQNVITLTRKLIMTLEQRSVSN